MKPYTPYSYFQIYLNNKLFCFLNNRGKAWRWFLLFYFSYTSVSMAQSRLVSRETRLRFARLVSRDLGARVSQKKKNTQNWAKMAFLELIFLWTINFITFNLMVFYVWLQIWVQLMEFIISNEKYFVKLIPNFL